ncbi:MAG TPA: hypothetical protein VFM68_03710 [Candidatus Saccharimonadales bacterium]|nr:hypothetical protein [Candidatus Saccharimonadales bacterium]
MEQIVQTREKAPSKVNLRASLYEEMLQSRNYADKNAYPDIENLEQLEGHWQNAQSDPERSRRGIKQIDVLLGRIAFEIMMRKREAEQ